MKRRSFLAAGLAAGFLCVSAGAQEVQPQPISVGIVFDTSQSMGGKLKYSRQVLERFLKAAHKGDEFLLLLTDDRPHFATGFSFDTKDILDLLAFVRSRGRSALYDTIHLAVHEMKAAANSRRCLLVISDGANNQSHYTKGDVENSAREARVEIYTVGVYESVEGRGRSPEENSGPRTLLDLAERTGGKHYVADVSLGKLLDVGVEVSDAMHGFRMKQLAFAR